MSEGEMVDVICPTCGKVRKIPARKIKKRKTMLCYLCSAKLMIEGRSKDSYPKGKGVHNWNGGRTKDGSGYIQIILYPENPFYEMACKNGHRIREHRLVMAQYLGRCLGSDEFVHHKNGDKADNRIENLQLMHRSAHYSTLHLKDLQEENNKLKEKIKELENKIKEWGYKT